MAATLHVSAGLASRRSADGITDLVIAHTVRETPDLQSTGPANKVLVPLVALRNEVFTMKAVSGSVRVAMVHPVGHPDRANPPESVVTAAQSRPIGEFETVEWLMREGEQVCFLSDA